MILCGIDVETTGVDILKDDIIELGYAMWDTDLKTVLHVSSSFIMIPGPIPPESTEIHNITNDMLKNWGRHGGEVFEELASDLAQFRPSYMVGHNGRSFDKKMLEKQKGVDTLKQIPWLDTQWDIPLAKEPRSRALINMAAEVGVFNPFAHRAVFDVVCMLKMLSFYNIEEVITKSKEPFLVVNAVVNYDHRHLAKQKKFSWENLDDMNFPKKWVKRIRKNDFPAFREGCNFEITVLKEISP